MYYFIEVESRTVSDYFGNPSDFLNNFNSNITPYFDLTLGVLIPAVVLRYLLSAFLSK